MDFDDKNFQEKVNLIMFAGTGGFSDSYCESFGFEKTEIQYQTDLQRSVRERLLIQMITYDEIYNRMKSEFSAKSKYDFDEAE